MEPSLGVGGNEWSSTIFMTQVVVKGDTNIHDPIDTKKKKGVCHMSNIIVWTGKLSLVSAWLSSQNTAVPVTTPFQWS